MLNGNCNPNMAIDLQPEPKKPRVLENCTTSSTRHEISLQLVSEESPAMSKRDEGEESGRERLKRHRMEMAGQVWVPDVWGQERLLKDWVDCTAIDSSLVPNGVVSARQALVEECRRANSGGLRIAREQLLR